jgi:hypothetical protein
MSGCLNVPNDRQDIGCNRAACGMCVARKAT